MTKEHLEAIGQITLQYSSLEWNLTTSICRLSGDGSANRADGHVRVELHRPCQPPEGSFWNAPKLRSPADIEGLNKALGQIETAAAKRNAVVHALVWHATESGDLVHANLKRQKAAQWTSTSASVDDLRRVTEQMMGIRRCRA